MPTSSFFPIKCVLFDLDGTLLDTAPDLLAALNAVLVAEGREPFTLAQARHTVSHGSIGMLELAFGTEQSTDDLQRRRAIFLDYYQANISRHSRLFDAIPTVLETLEADGTPWGIVTNKPEYLTFPLLVALDLHTRPACIIGGDTLPVAKPHPEPLLLAAQRCGIPPAQCLYVGDAERDIVAGRNAGMQTLIAEWGYLNANNEHHAWPADGSLMHPSELLAWLT
ncbi:phosphoglycolate phosphatase [Thiothrix caldifontis]|uniref:phosphoglycolate phosphatase n=1 Tax=Thiothrix caldifontis TaxID=525918 RepID=A0A1H4DQS2_9GAMM|nr:phosphoglycolate phosphatase [Thiothrix caldifontis]SEA75091.1 phosphoglycolate phosphatase [Thiothrix caldifontis]